MLGERFGVLTVFSCDFGSLAASFAFLARFMAALAPLPPPIVWSDWFDDEETLR